MKEIGVTNVAAGASLIRLRPRDDCLYVSRGRSVLITARDGFIHGQAEQGLFVHLTRLASLYRYFINGELPAAAGLSNVDQHSWLGYYIAPAPIVGAGGDAALGPAGDLTQQTIELRLCRFVGEGLHEDVQVTNYSTRPLTSRLELEIDADFAGLDEVRHGRRQRGRRTRRWRESEGGWSLAFDYRAQHRYAEHGERGTATLHRGVRFRIDACDSPPAFKRRRISFDIALEPRQTWRGSITAIPYLDGKPLIPQFAPWSFAEHEADYDRRARTFLAESTRCTSDEAPTLTSVVVGAFERARRDLTALRLFDLDRPEGGGWVAAAGLPIYLALFGRDALTSAWQAALLGPELMAGTLPAIAELEGTTDNPWRDEEPGKLPHQADTGPTSTLGFSPLSRYYGSSTTSGFFPVVVSELWHWTGDKQRVLPFVEPALRALGWLDAHGDLDGDGFYEYKTRSRAGLVNQGWKDSSDAIVHEDGTLVNAPIATSEEQAFVYIAKLHLAEVLWWLDRKDEAKRLFREARELKTRFNNVFWQADLGFLAMGLDPQKRPIRSIGSNALHCLAAGIVDDGFAETIANRLMAPDLFSGWGIRTLSADHPSYNPYSYHRGSIWPVEHGACAIGFLRYGLHAHLDRLCRAQFEAAQLYDAYRLPELFAGHQRTESQPFPAMYPEANSPQAWSASAICSFVQALTGIYPYAPLNLLLVDPHLPSWLPDLTVESLRVGDARISMRFHRNNDGHTSYQVIAKEGPLHVVRQPSPWSLTATSGERIMDALRSLVGS